MENTCASACPETQARSRSAGVTVRPSAEAVQGRGEVSLHTLVRVGPRRGVRCGVVWARVLSPSPKWLPCLLDRDGQQTCGARA